MRQFAIKQMETLDSIAVDLRGRGVSISTVVDRMIHPGVQNPRNALQIVNAFAQSWWLAKRRETEELGTEKPGGLHEGAVTDHPVTLGVLSAIRVNFPDFYRDVQDDPSLLQRMTDVLVREIDIKELPLASQQLLKERYLKQSDEGKKLEVRQEHRPLRQFLASLVGLRWPESIQSLLLLSEDPVTRKFGSKAARIHESFVSGDTKGVLEGFGRQADKNQLKPEEARLLALMVEDLRYETRIRKNNASRVIADLVDRLPTDVGHMLLGPLCRELNDSSELRSLLGLEKITKVLYVAQGEDKRAVVSRLINDILVSDQEMEFRLESLERPNLSEAVDFAQMTVDIALPVRRDQGLEFSADERLRNWLIDRTVVIGEKHHQVSFNKLEEWVNSHEDHLLFDLGVEYVDLLASELEGEQELEFNITPAIARAKKIFELLKTAGEDSRPGLWEFLSRYVQLHNPEASRMAWEEMVKHHDLPTGEEISKFIVSFVGRLSRGTEEEGWALDLEDGANTLIANFRSRHRDLNSSAISSLVDLCILWSQYDTTSEISSQLFIEIYRERHDYANPIIDDWTDRLITNLPIECIQEIAKIFHRLEKEQKAKIVAQLKPVVASENVEESAGKRYNSFMEGIQDEAWDEDVLRSHLDFLANQIGDRNANPNNYLTWMFPIFVRYIDYISYEPLGSALYKLFTQSKANPKLHVWLHSRIAKRWPTPSEEMKPYDPVQIFNDGVEVVTTHPNTASKGILLSLRNLVDDERVPVQNRQMVVKAACAVWKVNPEIAKETLVDKCSEVSPPQAADLLDAIDWSNEEHQEMLRTVWVSIVKQQNSDQRVDTTTQILEKGVSGPEEEPDMAVRIWLDSQGEDQFETLHDAIVQQELNDTHRKRLWNYAMTDESMDSRFFLDVVPTILKMESVQETARQIFADIDLVSDKIGSVDHRSEFAKSMMNSFPFASTNTIKASIAEWCKKLSGEASLRVLDPNELDDQDMKILESKFGRSPAVKKLEKEKKTADDKK